MKNLILLITALALSTTAFAQPSNDWPVLGGAVGDPTGEGSTYNYSISGIPPGGIISNGDEIGIFVSTGGKLYLIGEGVINVLDLPDPMPDIATASFGASETKLGAADICAGQTITIIKIYDTDASGGSNSYYDLDLGSGIFNPDGNAPTAAGTGSFNNNNNALVPSSSLPVELISFSGKKHSEGIALTWITATELNNDYFTISRSADGETFEEIEDIQGAGTTLEEQQYFFIDETPFDGTNYYRLTQTDFDGTFYHSHIIAVHNKELQHTPNISIFPNPVASTANIIIPAYEGEVEIKIADISGKVVQSQVLTNPQAQTLQMDFDQLQNGMYLLSIINGTQVATKQIIVQH